jgi:hypothetical protein
MSVSSDRAASFPTSWTKERRSDISWPSALRGAGAGVRRAAAAMRKSGAEIGRSITGVFSVLLAVFVPPVQLGVVVVPTVIAWVVSARRKGALDGGQLAA